MAKSESATRVHMTAEATRDSTAIVRAVESCTCRVPLYSSFAVVDSTKWRSRVGHVRARARVPPLLRGQALARAVQTTQHPVGEQAHGLARCLPSLLL